MSIAKMPLSFLAVTDRSATRAPQTVTGLKPSLPLAVISLAGTQVEMGRQHGELLRQAGG